MRTIVFVSAVALVAMTTSEAWSQGGGRGGFGGGGLGGGGPSTGGARCAAGSMMGAVSNSFATGGGASSLGTGPSTFSSTVSSAAQLRQQMQVAYLQQAYLQQAQANLLRQQAAAAKRADTRQRQLATHRARREAELARRSSGPTNGIRSRDEQFAALAN